METLGERLKAAREEKELTTEEAAKATKIPLNYLQALESGAFEVFSSDLHARGFLRNYALFLELDPEETLDLYDQQRGNAGSRYKGIIPAPVAVAVRLPAAQPGSGGGDAHRRTAAHTHPYTAACL